MVTDILSEPGMRKALEGKLLISILARVTGQQIKDILAAEPQASPTRVIRTTPNTPAIVRESMTVITSPTAPLPEPQSQLVEWIFTQIGRVVHLPPSNMDIYTALCGSEPAFLALMLELLTDGAVAMGLPRAEA